MSWYSLKSIAANDCKGILSLQKTKLYAFFYRTVIKMFTECQYKKLYTENSFPVYIMITKRFSAISTRKSVYCAFCNIRNLLTAQSFYLSSRKQDFLLEAPRLSFSEMYGILWGEVKKTGSETPPWHNQKDVCWDTPLYTTYCYGPSWSNYYFL